MGRILKIAGLACGLWSAGLATALAAPIDVMSKTLDPAQRTACSPNQLPAQMHKLNLNFRERPLIGRLGLFSNALCAAGGSITAVDRGTRGPVLEVTLPGGGDLDIDCRPPNGSFLRCDTIFSRGGPKIDDFFDLPYVVGFMGKEIREHAILMYLLSGPMPITRLDPRALLDQSRLLTRLRHASPRASVDAAPTNAEALAVVLTLRNKIFPELDKTKGPEPLAIDLHCDERLRPVERLGGLKGVQCIATLIERKHKADFIADKQLQEIGLTEAMWRAGKNFADAATTQRWVTLVYEGDTLKLGSTFDLADPEMRRNAELILAVSRETTKQDTALEDMKALEGAFKAMIEAAEERAKDKE